MGGKFRISRKSTKGRGKLRKGHSSSSNPTSRKYRDIAKNVIYCDRKGQGGLTQQALSLHNSVQNMKVDDLVSNEETQSLGGESFATAWTDCSNACFNNLLRNWQSNSVLHKEMLSVLAAVTEVIKSKGGKESETEYFAALIIALDNIEKDESATAILSLLSIVMKSVPPSVLKLKFSDSCKVLIGLLEKYINSNYTAVVCRVIHCIAILLRHQEITVWNLSSTTNIYNSILVLTTHSKPKVRKAAQHAICSILKGSDIVTQNHSLTHPASSVTAKFCIRTIEENGGGKNSTTTLHVLGLLKEILHLFPSSQLKASCEVMLKIMTLGNTLIITCSLQAFHGMFQNKPNLSNLSVELNAQIISALYEYQPGINDTQLISAWLTVMQEALCNLSRLNDDLFLGHVSKFFDVATHCWLSDKKEVWNTVTNVLKVLLTGCLKLKIDDLNLSKGSTDQSSIIEKIFQSIEKGLKYQYHLVWPHVLAMLTICFEIFGKQYSSFMVKCLQSLADLRDSTNFSYTKELDQAIGKAVTTMGPAKVLEAIPLDLDLNSEKLDFPRSWLLPVIRDNVKDTKLEFFTTYFLPLATKIQKKVTEYTAAKRDIEAKVYNVIQSQIWTMLPGFCTCPTDLCESFKGIAKILGTALSTRPDLRLDIMSSLRSLIKKNLDNDVNRREMEKFAKNYLPILFNLYTTEPKDGQEEHVRLAVYDTIKVYLQITETELCATLYQKATMKLEDPNLSSFNRHAILDICRALTPYISQECLSVLFKYCIPLLEHSDRTIQKKSYRIMEEICQDKTEGCQAFKNDHFQELKELMLKSLSSACPSSKAPRLRCLKHLVHTLDKCDVNFVTNIVPEAIFCIKENAEKIREAGYNLITEIGHAFLRWNPENSKDAIQSYIELLLAGLGGNPHFVSATILCFGRVVFEFKEQIPSGIIHNLIENATTLLTSSSREIVQATLSFIKSLFVTLDSTDLAQYVEILVKNLIHSISQDSQRKLRFKTKEIFTRLIRKFGYEMISKFVPESHKKFISNIHKIELRKNRRKADENESPKKKKLENFDDSESEDEVTDKVKHGNAWIEEEGDEIVDLLGPSASRKVLATKPEKKTKPCDFKTAPDGRLIICDADDDDDDEDDTMKKKKRKASTDVDMLDEADSLLIKKKHKTHDENYDEDNLEDLIQSTVVNKGIHRNTNLKDMKKTNEYGKEYKAKKARGDVKKKGRPDPYAYIPLDRKFLSKRKRAKMAGQFKGIVKAAKRGAQKGKKGKKQRMKK